MDANGYEEEEVRAFGRAYARGRMWERYADNHRGICLAFSANCMTEVFYEQIKRFGAATIGPVNYTEAGFVVSDARLIDSSELSEENTARVLTDHVLAHHREFWFLKVLDWDTEYEYRFVVFAPTIAEDEPIDVPFGSCLRAVIRRAIRGGPGASRSRAGARARSCPVPSGVGQWPTVDMPSPLTRRNRLS